MSTAGVELVVILIVVIVLLSVALFGVGWKLSRTSERKRQLERQVSHAANAGFSAAGGKEGAEEEVALKSAASASNNADTPQS